jgi:hypothetical protein
MVPLPVVVRHELVEGAQQPPLPKQDQPIETLFADRPHEPFGVGVGIRRLERCQHDPRHGALEDVAESVGPLPVSIADEDPVPTRNPSTASVSRRAACAMNHASGVGVEPAT